MRLDVKNCVQSAVARWDSWAPSWHKFFLIPNTSLSIKRAVSQFMFTSSAIILTVNFRSGRTSSPTHAALSPVRVADGHPLRCLSARRILPSENISYQRKACAFDTASSPKACWSFPCVVVAMSPSLTQKEKMAYRWMMFRASFSWQGSQTPPDMSSTYSTLRHCTAMPLQVRIEEGRRSKAVHVRRLQYCQYRQEKISLITLLSDLVNTIITNPITVFSDR